MKIDRPNSNPLTKAELEHLDTLKALIQGAIADGVLTSIEHERIQGFITADGKVTPEELNLVRDIVWNKIQAGELVLEWS